MQYDHNGKDIKESKGKNIRFTDEGHLQLSKFCIKKGYKLGVYCETAAVDKMKKEIKK